MEDVMIEKHLANESKQLQSLAQKWCHSMAGYYTHASIKSFVKNLSKSEHWHQDKISKLVQILNEKNPVLNGLLQVIDLPLEIRDRYLEPGSQIADEPYDEVRDRFQYLMEKFYESKGQQEDCLGFLLKQEKDLWYLKREKLNHEIYQQFLPSYDQVFEFPLDKLRPCHNFEPYIELAFDILHHGWETVKTKCDAYYRVRLVGARLL